jgi:hypothetical protein
MTKRAIWIAAGAIAACAAGQAAARTPLSIDPTAPADPGAVTQASPYATLTPSAFEPPAPPTGSFTPSLHARGPRLQCVPFARAESGVEIYGDADTWWSQAQDRFATARAPDQGAVIVMRGYRNPNRGHVGVVRQVVNRRLILVDHANWMNRGEITRRVPVRDVSAAGDWSQIQVWNVRGRHWGGRTYEVQGFILAPEAGGEDVAVQRVSRTPLG